MPATVTPDLAPHIDSLIALRRHLHRHPELSHQERETANHVAQQLEAWGIPFRRGLGGEGIAALIEGGRGSDVTIGIRGDMDALPITEDTGLEFASGNPGVMHACGHDAHTAMALTAARVFHERRDSLRGNVKVIIQPAEEADPCGADMMINDGVLEDPHVDAMVGLHVYPFIPSGKVGVKRGYAAANADRFEIEIRGRGGHAAYPHLTVDPIVIAAHTITALQTIASRRISPLEPAVVTVGVIEGAVKTNVIPAKINLAGTFRTLRAEAREKVAEEIRVTGEGIARAMGGEADVKIVWGCPCVYNNTALSDLFLEVAREVLGEENAVTIPESQMGADDFAFYCQRVPSLYFRLGTGNAEKGTDYPLHHPKFNIDEDSLPVGLAMLVATVERMFERGIPAREI